MKDKNFLRSIDRAVLGIIGLLILINSIYLIGPWYIDTYPEGEKAPLHTLFVHDEVVVAYGAIMLVDASLLLWGVYSKFNRVAVLSWALLTAFLMRLYAIIGIFIVLDEWLPPSYLPLVSTVMITGAYYIWVQHRGKPAK